MTRFFILFLALSSCAVKNFKEEKSACEIKPNFTCPFKLEKSGLNGSITWETIPTEEQSGSFVVRFWSINDERIPPTPINPTYTVSTLLWMPSMGHGSVPTKMEQLGVGLFRAKNIFFTMQGQWEVRIMLKSGKNAIDDASLSVSF